MIEAADRRGGPLDELAALRSLLAVCAHPDDESFGLGALLDAARASGVATAVLSFTRGESSTLGCDGDDLGAIRATELASAAAVLGAGAVELLDHGDGVLDATPVAELADEVVRFVSAVGAGGLLAFDTGGITGHPDHERATAAAVEAGRRLGLPVLAWAVPQVVAAALNSEYGTAFAGRSPEEIDLVVQVDREAQFRAIGCHASQATDNPVLWRRLELTGPVEWLRWLRPPAPAVSSPAAARRR